MRCLYATTVLALGGCFESIQPLEPDAAPLITTDDGGPQLPSRVTTTQDPDGSFRSTIDSTSMTEWVHVDFTDGSETSESATWDLRFQRFHISTNGGESGTADVATVAIAGTPFTQVTTAPETGWISDAPDGDDTNLEPDYAFEQGDGWYAYDEMTHVLTPRPLVWVVRTSTSALLKLEITAYYDAAGTAGWFSLHWSPL